MGTTPDAPEPVPTRRQRAFANFDAAVRVLLAGSSVGAVRRIALYALLVLALGIIAVSALGGVAPVAVVLALAVTLLLAVTDKLA